MVRTDWSALRTHGFARRTDALARDNGGLPSPPTFCPRGRGQTFGARLAGPFAFTVPRRLAPSRLAWVAVRRVLVPVDAVFNWSRILGASARPRQGQVFNPRSVPRAWRGVRTAVEIRGAC